MEQMPVFRRLRRIRQMQQESLVRAYENRRAASDREQVITGTYRSFDPVSRAVTVRLPDGADVVLGVLNFDPANPPAVGGQVLITRPRNSALAQVTFAASGGGVVSVPPPTGGSTSSGGASTATEVSFDPAGSLSATDVQAALEELDSDLTAEVANRTNADNTETTARIAADDALAVDIEGRVSKDGDTMTGPLVLPGPPSAPNEAATKDYVDDLLTAVTPFSEGLFYLNKTIYAQTSAAVAFTIIHCPEASIMAALYNTQLIRFDSVTRGRIQVHTDSRSVGWGSWAPNVQRLYVGSTASDLSKWDVAVATQTNLNFGALGVNASTARQSVYCPTNNKIYVAVPGISAATAAILVINTSNDTITAITGLSGQPRGICYVSSQDRIFAVYNGGGISINPANDTVTTFTYTYLGSGRATYDSSKDLIFIAIDNNGNYIGLLKVTGAASVNTLGTSTQAALSAAPGWPWISTRHNRCIMPEGTNIRGISLNDAAPLMLPSFVGGVQVAGQLGYNAQLLEFWWSHSFGGISMISTFQG